MIATCKKPSKKLLSGVLLFSVLFGCSLISDSSKSVVEFGGSAFGSYYKIKYRSKTPINKAELQLEVEALIQKYDAEFSLWKTDSFLTKFNEETKLKPFPISTWANELYEGVLPIYNSTQGAFDPSVGPLVKLWGFGKNKSPRIPSAIEIKNTLKKIGLSKLKATPSHWTKTIPSLMLDFNGVAPGHVADLLGALLRNKGVKHYLIDVGGELVAKGGHTDDEPWRVGIETPSEAYAHAILQVVPLWNQAIATSGSYRNYLKTPKGKISHTIDPRSGLQPKNKIISATVIAPTALQADAWATAFMVMGSEVLLSQSKTLPATKGFAVYLLEELPNGNLKVHTNAAMDRVLKSKEF